MAIDLPAIGQTGIAAAEAALAAVESNITNASNPNYSSESVQFGALAGPNGAGAGVEVLGTTSAQAPFLTAQINLNQNTESYNQQFSQIATLAQQVIEPGSGTDLGSALQSVFDAFTNLAASPQDPTLRTAVINAAANFAQTAQSVNSGLGTIVSNQLSQLAPLVAQVNQDSQQIATLNSQIQATQTGGGNAGALIDQREALISNLASLVGASADSNGDVSVGGVPLVSGGTALTLATTGTGTSIGLEVQLSNGTVPVQMSSVGGTAGGILAGAQAVEQLQSQVLNYTNSVASAVNTQYQSGYGLDGSTGNTLFDVSATGGPISLDPNVTVQNLAAASSAAGVPGDGSNATAIAALANALGADSSLPSSTPAQAFSQIVSSFGTTLQTANNAQQQASSTLQSLTQLQGSITGVSINDQLTQLLQYQNLLQASGRAVQAADDMTTFLIQELSQ